MFVDFVVSQTMPKVNLWHDSGRPKRLDDVCEFEFSDALHRREMLQQLQDTHIPKSLKVQIKLTKF